MGNNLILRIVISRNRLGLLYVIIVCFVLSRHVENAVFHCVFHFLIFSAGTYEYIGNIHNWIILWETTSNWSYHRILHKSGFNFISTNSMYSVVPIHICVYKNLELSQRCMTKKIVHKNAAYPIRNSNKLYFYKYFLRNPLVV